MEEKNQNNLPAKVEKQGLLAKNPRFGRVVDVMRRAGIITASTAAAFVGLGMAAVGATPVVIAGWGVFLAGTTTAIRNTLNKTEPSLLFTSKKVGDTITISQDALNIGNASKMLGYSDLEKASMMGLQTLVGFSRYKQNFKDSPHYEIDENGNKIYSQKISTVTHSINLENLEHLQTLGYIKIDSMDEDFPLESLDEKLLLSKGTPRRSFLLTEKMGFGNWKGVREALRAMTSNDPALKESNSRVMKKVTFRLTDKKIDFDEIRNFSNPQYRKSLPEEKRRAAGKIGIMSRVIKSKHLEIKQDPFGRDYIKYPSMAEMLRINREREQARAKAEQERDVRRAASKYQEGQADFNQRIQKKDIEQPTIESDKSILVQQAEKTTQSRDSQEETMEL